MSTELIEAVKHQDLNRVAALLAQGADPNVGQTEWPYWTPLGAAIEELDNGGSMEMLHLLLKNGADVNGWDSDHQATPLLMAMFRNNKEVMRMLLEAGADPNAVGAEGDSPLRWAAENDDLEMAKLFLQFGADKTINKFGGFSRSTPLGLAAGNLSIPMIELLLNAGADPEAPDDDDEPARESLPPREFSDPEVWDTALELLSLRTA